MATISYNELPYIITSLSFDEDYTIFVTDSENPECKFEFEVFLENCGTGLEDAPFDDVNITQSPYSITIENNELEDLTIQLFSTTGALVGKMNLGKNLSNSFDTSALSQGLYFINISNGIGQKTIKAVVY